MSPIGKCENDIIGLDGSRLEMGYRADLFELLLQALLEVRWHAKDPQFGGGCDYRKGINSAEKKAIVNRVTGDRCEKDTCVEC